jgi:hypothetical protein
MMMTRSIIDHVDHLVYATPDVDATCADLERRLGVRASAGGQHIGRGTRNALIAVGPARYLEIIGPDPAQPAPHTPLWFGIDDLTAPRLVTWAAGATNLPELVRGAAIRGLQLGHVTDGMRERADGVVLRWHVTDPAAYFADGVVPFFIDWGTSPHPASTAVAGPTLVDLRGEHPNPQRMRELLSAVDLELTVTASAQPSLVATFEARAGLIELR